MITDFEKTYDVLFGTIAGSNAPVSSNKGLIIGIVLLVIFLLLLFAYKRKIEKEQLRKDLEGYGEVTPG